MLALTQFAINLGIRVERTQGENRQHTGAIYIDAELSEWEARCALAHYLAHDVLGHHPRAAACKFPGLEQEALELAALYLIDHHAFADAVREHGGNEDAVAAALQVSPCVLKAFQRALTEKRVLGPLVLSGE